TDIDKGVVGADAEFGIALLRDPIADIGDPMPRVNGGGAIGETRGECVALAGLRRIDAQFVKTRSGVLLRVTPADARHTERDTQEGGDFPSQHAQPRSRKSADSYRSLGRPRKMP